MFNKLRLLTPGPTPIPEDVRLALARDMIHHRKADFKRVMERIQPGLQHLFGTREQVLPLSCSGTGAMYAAVTNLFAPGEKVVVVEGASSESGGGKSPRPMACVLYRWCRSLGRP